MPMHRFSRLVPWQAKIAGKIALARLPIPNRLWRKLRLFRHGDMDNVPYAYKIFQRHYNSCDFPQKNGGFRMLELGPGDSLLSTLFAWSHGASQSWLVDVGPFASADVSSYRGCQQWLSARNLPTTGLSHCKNQEEVLAAHNSHYLTNGIKSLQSIESNSVDFIFSQAVLEHVSREEFVPTMIELRRILHPEGIASHRIDLRDHLGGALNNLRFRPKRWESSLFRSSGFYTNRIRFLEMLDYFEQSGFNFEVKHLDQWSELPTGRKHLAPEYRDLADDDLLVRGFDVALKPKANAVLKAA